MYDQLPENGIRLLYFDSPPNSYDLRCSLKTVQLSNSPHAKVLYTALSYCWRIPGDDYEPMTCNGEQLSVRTNLRQALVSMQLNGISPLWVDALCINQGDSHERQQQVLLMGQIYKSASKVVVWLGQDARPLGEIYNVALCTSSWEQHKSSFYSYLRNILDTMDPGGWFSRAWTFQEIVLAKRAVLFAGLSGGRMTWEHLVMCIERIAEFGTFWRNEILIRTIRNIEQMRKVGQTSDLLLLLLSIWNRKSSYPQDKVFAIVGLYNGSPRVYPDYNLSLLNTIIMTSKRCIESSMSLDVLLHSGLESTTFSPELPSWVADFSQVNKQYRSWLCMPRFDLSDLHSTLTFQPRWKGKRLLTAGIAYGRIFVDTGQKEQVRIEPFPSCTNAQGLDDGDNDTAVSRFLTLMSHESPQKVDIERLCQQLKHHDEGKCRHKCSISSKYQADDPYLTRLAGFSSAKKVETYGFSSRLLPTPARAGDWMCSLLGGQWPVLLRPANCLPGISIFESSQSSKGAVQTPSEGEINDAFILVGAIAHKELQLELKILAEDKEIPKNLLNTVSLCYADFELC